MEIKVAEVAEMSKDELIRNLQEINAQHYDYVRKVTEIFEAIETIKELAGNSSKLIPLMERKAELMIELNLPRSCIIFTSSKLPDKIREEIKKKYHDHITNEKYCRDQISCKKLADNFSNQLRKPIIDGALKEILKEK